MREGILDPDGARTDDALPIQLSSRVKFSSVSFIKRYTIDNTFTIK